MSPIFEETATALDALRAVLAEHRYTRSGIRERGIDPDGVELALQTAHREQLEAVEQPLDILVALWLVGLEVERRPVERLFGRHLEDLQRAELLTVSRSRVAARLKIVPYRWHWFLCDFMLRRQPIADPVYAPSLDSFALVEASRPLPKNRVLDLCTGTGILAILSSKHAQKAVGVDISARAIRLAKLNAHLNEAHNVEFIQGDLFAPVVESPHDVILANPPFVISTARDAHAYRDGGTEGDEVCHRVIDGLQSGLEPGGFCQIVTHLLELANRSQFDDIASRAKELGYACLIQSGPTFDKMQYARAQHRELSNDGATYEAAVRDFADRLAAVGFVRGALSVVTLRDRGGFRFERERGLPGFSHEPGAPEQRLRRFFELASEG